MGGEKNRQLAAMYAWLQKAFDAGWRDYQFASRDPMLENLRRDEKFKQIIDQMKSQLGSLADRFAEMQLE